MPRPARSDKIDYVLAQLVEAHPRDLVAVVAKIVGVSRSAVVARVRALIANGRLSKEGTTRPIYRPGPNHVYLFPYAREGLAEDQVWSRVQSLLHGFAPNVIEIAEYGVTEMVNNAIDHSEGEVVLVMVQRVSNAVSIVIVDDGVGIFAKIALARQLPDQRLALLELSKGKLTTDPSRHSGEGIFFTSRLFDDFRIRSGDLLFMHESSREIDLLLDDPNMYMMPLKRGTVVGMRIYNESRRMIADVFAEYSSGPDDYAFAKTVVPVRLAKLGHENLVSRSQAKRVLSGVDQFRNIVLDFADVEKIGQAFADEIFRVFALAHPNIQLGHVHATPEVQQMIRRAEVLRDEQLPTSHRP
jgi:anti-sigma regulatory factor (Ser/Thr protein kinase)